MVIDGANVFFTTQVEHEEISMELEMKYDTLKGMVFASEGAMSIAIVKKGRRSHEKKDKFKQNRHKRVD